MEEFRSLLRTLCQRSVDRQPAESTPPKDVNYATPPSAASEGLSFSSRDQIFDHIRQNMTRDEIQLLLDSTRPEQPPDHLAREIMDRTRAVEQLSLAHEFVYGFGKEAIAKCVLNNLSDPDGDFSK